MSDGNFNRALLPKNELTAGIRAGKAQMRTKALNAFSELLETDFEGLSEQQKTELKERFAEKLR